MDEDSHPTVVEHLQEGNRKWGQRPVSYMRDLSDAILNLSCQKTPLSPRIASVHDTSEA